MILGLLTEPLFKKMFDAMRVNRHGRIYRSLQVVRTFLFVNVGMLMFRADDLTVFGHMFTSMFKNFSFDPVITGSLMTVRIDMADFIVLVAGALILLVVGIYREQGHHLREELAEKNIVLRWAVYYVLIFSIIVFGAYGKGYEVAGFIYAQF